jgi:hypothetical protein
MIFTQQKKITKHVKASNRNKPKGNSEIVFMVVGLVMVYRGGDVEHCLWPVCETSKSHHEATCCEYDWI